MKNTGFKIPEKTKHMSKLDFHTITELKLYIGVLVFSVFSVSELIRRLMRVQLSRNLKKQCMYM